MSLKEGLESARIEIYEDLIQEYIDQRRYLRSLQLEYYMSPYNSKNVNNYFEVKKSKNCENIHFWPFSAFLSNQQQKIKQKD